MCWAIENADLEGGASFDKVLSGGVPLLRT